jgi:hypothetical protein
VDGHRRYADEPESVWYSGPGQYPTSSQGPYDPDVDRPGGAYRVPGQRDAEYTQREGEYEYTERDGEYAQRYTEYVTPSHYATPDPATSSGSPARTASAEPASAAQESAQIPVRGPEYPTIRPTGAASPADAPPATAYAGGSSAPTSGSPAPGLGTATALNEPTGSVPPILGFAPESKPSDGVYRIRRPVTAVLVAVGTVLLLVPAVFLLLRATFIDDPVARGIVPAVLLTLALPLAGLGLYALAGGGAVGRDAWLRPPVVYLPIGLVLLLAAGLAVA